jgi:hypothetical protein
MNTLLIADNTLESLARALRDRIELCSKHVHGTIGKMDVEFRESWAIEHDRLVGLLMQIEGMK